MANSAILNSLLFVWPTINEQNEIDKMFSGVDDDFATSLSMDQKSKHQTLVVWQMLGCASLIFMHHQYVL